MAGMKQSISQSIPISTVPRIGLNRTEVARAIGVSPNTVDVMVAEGVLPPPRKWHSRKVWLIGEVMAAMTEWPYDGRSYDNSGDDWHAS